MASAIGPNFRQKAGQITWAGSRGALVERDRDLLVDVKDETREAAAARVAGYGAVRPIVSVHMYVWRPQ